MAESVTLEPVVTAADLAAVRSLCWDYRDFLLSNTETDRRITETFYPTDRYQALMDRLAQKHARPRGCILLAKDASGSAIGCGMSQAIDPRTSEIKRVFTTDAARGKGVAARLCQALMDQARADGFTRMVLDTSIALPGAQRLYERLGFARRGPYQDVPADVLHHLVFFETAL